MIFPTTRRIGLACVGLLALALSACGSGAEKKAQLSTRVIAAPSRAQQPSAERIAEARRELAALPLPVGMDPALFESLRSAMDQMLAARNVSKLADQQRNTVSDAAVVDDGAGGFNLTWTFRNTGDYSSDGEVNISDITPLGLNLGKTSAGAGWDKAQAADGDGNGEVNLSDLTPIGANLFSEIRGYKLYQSASETGPWASLGQIELSESSSGYPRRFSYALGASPPAFILLSAYDSTGDDWQGGPDPIPATVTLGTPVPQDTQTIGTAGGTLTAPAGPVAGVKLTVPPAALQTDAQISLGYNDGTVTPVFGTQLGGIIEISTDYEEGIFDEPLLVTVPYSGNANEVPVPFYIDEAGGLNLCRITDLDPAGGTMTFNTWHASAYCVILAVLNQPTADVYDTKFEPRKHGFQIPNQGSKYNIEGECLGMAAFAGWFFRVMKDPGLYSSFMATLPGSSLTEQDVIATRSFNACWMPWAKEYRDFVAWQAKLSDSQEWLVIRAALLNSAKPIILKLANPSAQSFSGGHAVLGYAYVGNKLFIYDPNKPGQEPSINFNGTTFDDYGSYSRFAAGGDGSLPTREPFDEIWLDAVGGFAHGEEAFVNFTIIGENDGKVSKPVTPAYIHVDSAELRVETLQISNDSVDLNVSVDQAGEAYTMLPIKPGENWFQVRTYGISARGRTLQVKNNYTDTKGFRIIGENMQQRTITYQFWCDPGQFVSTPTPAIDIAAYFFDNEAGGDFQLLNETVHGKPNKPGDKLGGVMKEGGDSAANPLEYTISLPPQEVFGRTVWYNVKGWASKDAPSWVGYHLRILVDGVEKFNDVLYVQGWPDYATPPWPNSNGIGGEGTGGWGWNQKIEPYVF